MGKQDLANGDDSRTKERIFQLAGGHPVLDLVNTLDWRFRESGPEELLESYGDVVRFAEQSGLVSMGDASRLMRSAPQGKAMRVLAAVRELREAAAEILYAAVAERTPSTSAVKKLEESLAAAKRQQELRWTGERLEWELPESSSLPSWLLWLLTLSAAEFLTSEQMHFLRECGNPECRWLFVDTSKNHTRRWCDMKICGNRMKARRFRAEHGY